MQRSTMRMYAHVVAGAFLAVSGVVAVAQTPSDDAANNSRLGLGVFYEHEGGPGVEFDFSVDDLFGRGIEAEANFSTTERAREGRVGAGFTLSSGWDMGLTISGSRSDPRGVAFEHQAFGAELTLERQLSPDLHLSTRLRQSHSKIFRVISDQPILKDEEAAGWQVDRSIGYALRYRSPQSANDGYSRFLAGFSQDFSGFGGDRRYLVSRAYLTLRHGFMDGWVRTRAELEVAGLHMQSGNSRTSERFYLGDHMRGFRKYGAGPRDTTATGNDMLGGNFLAVARLDAEVPMTRAPDNKLFGGAFLDIGSAWGLDDVRAASGGMVDDQIRLRAVAGVNLGWDTGMGRLNVTIADSLVKQNADKVMNVNVAFSTRF